MNVVEIFWKLCKEAKELGETTIDSRQREPALLEILKHVNAYPSSRKHFAYCFMHLFHWPELGPFDIIEYSMAELRWPEVQTFLAGIAEITPELNCKYIANRILAAFNPVWPTGQIYSRYSCRATSPEFDTAR